jgi:hypothetical protein
MGVKNRASWNKDFIGEMYVLVALSGKQQDKILKNLFFTTKY